MKNKIISYEVWPQYAAENIQEITKFKTFFITINKGKEEINIIEKLSLQEKSYNV